MSKFKHVEVKCWGCKKIVEIWFVRKAEGTMKCTGCGSNVMVLKND